MLGGMPTLTGGIPLAWSESDRTEIPIMKFTYYGHSCFSVLAGGKTLLFDPFVTGNQLARAIDVDRIEADFIFVFHGHFDHTTDVARIAKRTGAKVLGNWEIFQAEMAPICYPFACIKPRRSAFGRWLWRRGSRGRVG